MTDSSSKKIVLIVDDAPTNLSILTEILRPFYQLRASKSGALALKIARASTPPDAIILDVEMPDMDGFEVCEELKADDVTRGIPVIFVTGHASLQARARGEALGGVGFISKPVEPATVLAALQAVLA